MHQVVSDWQNWCRNLSAFREEAMRQTVVFDCSAESRILSRMLNIHGACLPAECTEMWKIFMGFFMKVDVLLSTSWLMC